MDRTRWIILLVVVLAAIWLLTRRRARLPTALPKAAPTSHVKLEQPPVATSSIAGLDAKTLQQAQAEDRLGFQRAAYINDGPKRFLAAEITPQPGCNAGDLDLISVAAQGVGSVLLSLEAVDSGEFFALHEASNGRVLSIAELKEGASLRLPVTTKDLRVYGLYLCTDRDHHHSCQNKPAANVRDPYAGRIRRQPPKDAVFFFQPMLFDSQKILLFAPAGKDLVPKMEEYLSLRHSTNLLPAVKASGQLGVSLGSTTAFVTNAAQGGTVHITLPYLDDKACSKSRTAAPE